MNIADAQANMRHSYFGGAPGLASSAVMWLLAGLVVAARDPQTGVFVLIFGGMLIHPLAILGCRILGRPGAHDKANPLGPLALESTVILLLGDAGMLTWPKMASPLDSDVANVLVPPLAMVNPIPPTSLLGSSASLAWMRKSAPEPP